MLQDLFVMFLQGSWANMYSFSQPVRVMAGSEEITYSRV